MAAGGDGATVLRVEGEQTDTDDGDAAVLQPQCPAARKNSRRGFTAQARIFAAHYACIMQPSTLLTTVAFACPWPAGAASRSQSCQMGPCVAQKGKAAGRGL